MEKYNSVTKDAAGYNPQPAPVKLWWKFFEYWIVLTKLCSFKYFKYVSAQADEFEDE